MKSWLNKVRTRQAVFVHDAIVIPVAWMGSYWLRFNLSPIPPEFLEKAVRVLPEVWIIQGFVFWYFGLYRGVWRFASVPDVIRIAKAVIVGMLCVATALLFTGRLTDIPRSIFVLDTFLLALFLGGPRLVYRWLKDRYLYDREDKKVLIVGAGQAGEMLARDLMRDRSTQFSPAVFVDDDNRKIGKEIHGIPVVGSCDDIPSIVSQFSISLILIATTGAGSKEIRRIVGICETANVPFRILPRMQDVVDGQVSVKELRDVRIEDLLGRESVALDWAAIIRGTEGKTVFVTGGGGSIGSELCRQISRLKPAKLVVFERSEFNLYTIDLELRRDFPDIQLVSILGDVADSIAVENALVTHHPDVIFHAAAYKHVPMLEGQVRSAVTNNVFGTQTLASLAHEHGCPTFVMISTDKAVNPANVMGATKRVAEIYCQNLNERSITRFITVRFGNVLGSAGSVIPLFQKQIAAGGPVTVTHPEITRYFMTIPESCQLILQASVIGEGGEIFVLDMGEPVKISYLAEQLVLLSGKKPGEDIEIVYTGLRPGEKLYEELFHVSEKLGKTRHPKILLANSRKIDKEALNRTLSAMEWASKENNEAKLRLLLYQLVPEYAAEQHRAVSAESKGRTSGKPVSHKS